MLSGQTELSNFKVSQFPRDIMRIHLIAYDKDSITIGFPSWSKDGKVNTTCFDLHDSKNDWCLCEGQHTYKLYCWHLKYRAVILKGFLNRKTGDDKSWLTHLDAHRKNITGEIIEYWMSLYDHQEVVSQRDLLDLELRDHFGFNIDRRVIGAAIRVMKNAKMIYWVGEEPAQYTKRKGGMVGLWRKVS